MFHVENLIDGAESAVAERIEFRNPATGEVSGSAPASSAEEVDRAVQAARKAFVSWRRSTPQDRANALLKLADLIEEHQDEILDREVASTGKPRESTRAIEVVRGADQLRFLAGAARVVTGTAQAEYIAGFTSSVRREPVGVVAQITPWNYPFMMGIWKIGAAIATGNTLVIKPAETTPPSTVLLGQLAQQVLPAGVLNVVCGGRDTGAALTSHPDVDMVAITGSTRAGREVMAAAAPTVKPLHLELGGKAPAVVFPDVDIAATAAGLGAAAFYNAGQDCTAVTRVIVHESIADELEAELVKVADAVGFGDPAGSEFSIGPLNSQAQLDRALGYLERLPEHTKVLTGGTHEGPGYWLRPAIVSGAKAGDEVLREELFAPVIAVQRFTTEAEAVQFANDCDYGLAASVWSKDGARTGRVIRDLDFGETFVNCHQVCPAEAPHGGFKQSGHGTDLSIFAIESYTRIKSVTVALGEAAE